MLSFENTNRVRKAVFYIMLASILIYSASKQAMASPDVFNSMGDIMSFLSQYIVNAMFGAVDTIFGTFGLVVIIFFLIKTFYYFATKNPNKFAIVTDLIIFALLYGIHQSIGETGTNEFTGWKIAYIAVFAWLIYTNFRKSIFLR